LAAHSEFAAVAGGLLGVGRRVAVVDGDIPPAGG